MMTRREARGESELTAPLCRLLSAVCLLVLISACADKPKRVAISAPPPETVYVRKPVVAPRAPALPVSPARLDFAALNDTARLTVPIGAQCAAASEDVARIDSTGLVTSVANGDTHVRCWQDGQVATIKVRVQQQLFHVMVVADRALEMGHAGDSLHLSLAQTDKRGAPVVASPPTWLSLTPGIVTVDQASGLATSVADSGTARIVGQVDSLADTILVQVGAKGVATKQLARTTTNTRARALATAAREAQRNAAAAEIASNESFSATGTRQAPTQGLNAIGARAPRLNDSLFRDPSSNLGGLRWIVPNAFGDLAERRVIPSASGSLAKSSGALFGGGLDITTRGVLSFRVAFATGTLTGDTTTSGTDKSLTVTQGSFDACMNIAPWLTVLGGAESRSYQAASSLERWLMVRAGGEAAFNLGGGPLWGYARALVMPLISAQNDVSPITTPSFGMEAGLGVGLETQRLSTRIMYDIQHYSFPSTSGRKEQFAQLVFRFGYKFGW